MIDLSTLIALLTALASATTPTGAGPVEPGTASPPAQHCRVTAPAPTDPARSDGTGATTGVARHQSTAVAARRSG